MMLKDFGFPTRVTIFAALNKKRRKQMNDLEKQRMIIRQSSIKAGLEFFGVNKRVCSLDELTSVAEALTTYVLEGRTEEYKKRLKGLDDKLK